MQIAQLLSQISGAHVTGISREDQEILVLRFIGWSPDDIAAHFFKHPRTVYARIEHLVSMFCTAAGLEYDLVYLSTFARDHALCDRGCLGAGAAYLERSHHMPGRSTTAAGTAPDGTKD